MRRGGDLSLFKLQGERSSPGGGDGSGAAPGFAAADKSGLPVAPAGWLMAARNQESCQNGRQQAGEPDLAEQNRGLVTGAKAGPPIVSLMLRPLRWFAYLFAYKRSESKGFLKCRDS